MVHLLDMTGFNTQSDDMPQYTEKQSLYIEVHDSDPLLVHTAGIKFIFSQKFIFKVIFQKSYFLTKKRWGILSAD